MRIILPLSALFLCAAATNCAAVKLTPDNAMAAIEAEDFTGLIEGCGKQLIAGFDYCRVQEGDNANQEISFIGPPSACREDACVFIKVYDNKGNVAWGGSIPRGKTRVTVPWKELLKSDTFTLGQRGFYTYNHEVHWVDTEGRDRVSYSQGEIVLRVYKKGYMPLNNVSDDPNFAWSWREGDRLVKMTTGMRVYVGEVQ